MTATSAIYPGSFDPITNGHLDIIQRAKKRFEKVVIGVIHNPNKTPYFSLEERITLIQALFQDDPNIRVEGFEGLLIDFAKSKKISTIIRGLRAVSDFDYEFQMALTNRHLWPDIETVFLMTDVKYAYLSSSLIKQLAQFQGNIEGFVPPLVAEALAQKVKKG